MTKIFFINKINTAWCMYSMVERLFQRSPRASERIHEAIKPKPRCIYVWMKALKKEYNK